jgi:hypothetical protein
MPFLRKLFSPEANNGAEKRVRRPAQGEAGNPQKTLNAKEKTEQTAANETSLLPFIGTFL